MDPLVAVAVPAQHAKLLRVRDVEALVKQLIGDREDRRIGADLDGANVGLKAWDENIHRIYTGQERRRIHANFEAAFRAGLKLKANVVFIPGFVDVDQVEALARWLAGLDTDIPFHVMGYIPVPDAPWRRPTDDEMAQAVGIARRYLDTVTFSHFTSEQAKDLEQRDDRFAVRQVL